MLPPPSPRLRPSGRSAGPRLLLRVILAAALAAPVVAPAQDLELPTVIRAARVVTAPGEVIENGSILVRDGVIAAIGASVEAPAGAEVLEFENLTVYPGLIESYHARALPVPAGDDDDGAVQLGHPNDLIRPERSAAEASVAEDDVKKLRNAGFTLAVGVPENGVLRGSAVLQTLGDGSLRENLQQTGLVMGMGFDTSSTGGYPSSLMGSLALLRQVVSDARWYADALDRYGRDPAQRKPDFDASLAALGDVVAGRQRVLVETMDSQDAVRALAMLQELDLDGVLLGSGTEYERLQALQAAGVAIVLPVDFPSAPSVEDADDVRPPLGELRHWKAAPGNPVDLLGAGLTVAFTTHGLSSPDELFAHLARSVERGLTQEQALAALTTTPAALYGIADVAGTLEVGKMANFLLAEGDLFVEKPKIQEIWVEGRRYELEEIQPPEVNPVGEWTVLVSAGGQQIEAALVIRGSLEDLDGEMTVMGNSIPLEDVTVSGRTAIISVDASAMGGGDFVLRMTIDGDEGSGSGDSPMGAFTFTAKRTSGSPGEGGRP